MNLALGFGTTLLYETSGKSLNLLFSSRMELRRQGFIISSATVLVCSTRQVTSFFYVLVFSSGWDCLENNQYLFGSSEILLRGMLGEVKTLVVCNSVHSPLIHFYELF